MQTKLELYRSLQKKEWRTVPQTPEEALTSRVLYPSFVDKPIIRNGRPDLILADMKVEADSNGYNYAVRDKPDGKTGGTSLFNKPKVFGPGRHDFVIPSGTEVPESLRIIFTHHNKRFDAAHYQIEPTSGRMEVGAFTGALDNLARNAVVRQIALTKV